jgi:hypothetical protein
LSNNFDLFKRKILVACMEWYKNLGCLIMDGKYFVPPNVDLTLYDLTNDPFKIVKSKVERSTQEAR